jgi:apolipoprotein N-acyltransferase
MQDAVAVQALNRKPILTPLVTLVRSCVPTLAEASLATSSALFLILSFPNSDLWPLAWIALAPLFAVVARHAKPARAFVLGWLWGAIFFYGTCWWLTYSMIHYGHLRPWVAYLLLVLPVALVALFPALSCLALARLTVRLGPAALFAAPFIWVSLEWARYAITGEMWNAVGYSQAFHPMIIQTARWSGVFALGFLIATANAAVAFGLIRRTARAAALAVMILGFVAITLATAFLARRPDSESSDVVALIVAVQPNVPMDGSSDLLLSQRLLNRHIELSTEGLHAFKEGPAVPRLVIWPESPMTFTYTSDTQLQKTVADFATANHTSVLLNSLEPAPNGGGHNSAIMVNQEGRMVSQYDKIRLMPFGEYVPLPRWLPGASSVRAIVGEFTPGSSYTLMPLGDLRAGVFICFEAAHPSIARTFTNEGADILINISNDGYLGPTPVMRQHLANAVFRAVENGRDVLRVTNTGITAYIDSSGRVFDATPGFEPAVRTWTVSKKHAATTSYTRHGDVFVYACLMITMGFVSATLFKTRRSLRPSTIKRG